MSIWELIVSYWRTLFDRSRKPSKSYYPVAPIGPPATTTTTVTVSQAPPSIVLGTLSFSATSFTVGAVASGTINGATALSTITATGLPAGLTINGTARTESWDGTGTPGTGSISVTETLAGASNSPRLSVISYSISAASGTLSPSTAPQILGDAIVGQRVYFQNGTYNIGGVMTTPDSFTQTVTVGGVAVDHDTDSLLVLDDYAGLAIGYSEIAHKSGYSDSASNAATSTGTVTAIDNGGTALSIPNAITSVTRTSASTVIPMTADIAFASNVYEGYFLRRDVYSDSGLTTLLGFATHLLTHADLQSGATIDWSADGGPTIAATNWITYTVFTTSPNGYMYYFTFPTQISPTDAVVAMTWSATDKSAGVTLSTDHLTMTNTTGSGSVRANRGIGAGKKVYWEYTGVTSASIGAADASATLTPFWGASDDGLTETNDAGSWVNIDGGILAFGTTASGHKVRVSTSSLWTNTDVLGLSLDTTGASPILAAYLNGTLKNSITMVGISLPIFPATQGSSGNAATLNPGITPGGTDGVAHPQTGFVNP